MIDRFFLSLLLTLTFSFNFYAQQQADWCGTDYYNENIELSEEEREKAKQKINELRKASKEFLENKDLSQYEKSDDVYIIPLVVHVIHDNGVGNISYEQIKDGVRILNEDLRRLNADTTQTREVFLPFAKDSKIEFRLAKLDPEGNCTNGVVRINDPFFAYNGNDDAKALSVWPTDRYFNYWLANFLPSDGGGSLLGYARFPWWGINNRYGVMQRNDEFGSIGTASNSSGRTTIHEVGHCFGLYHTFQSGCGNDCSNSGDEVCDTPPVAESSWGCLTGNNTCSNDMVGPSPFEDDVIDQIENYMSYNSCQNMLSEGQIVRMHWVLDGFNELINLASEENLEATGVDLPNVLCKAEFQSSNAIICAGEAVSFIDFSYHGPTEWNWSFPGGEPSVSNEQDPTIIYNTPGNYDVILSVSDGIDTVSTELLNYVKVLDNGVAIPFTEGFEDYSQINESSWMVEGQNNNGSFEITENAAYNGDKSIRLPNFLQQFGNKNALISSPIDLSSIDEDVTLSFRYAYRKKSTNNEDWLRISFSNDCGIGWALRRNIRGDQLGTNLSSISWQPSSKEDWTTVHVTNITSQFWMDKFMVKFELENGGGNNFYMDDINIYKGDESNDPSLVEDDENTSSLVSHEKHKNFTVYPNPTTNDFNISFSLATASTIKISVFDALGQTMDVQNIQGNQGENIVLMNGEKYAKGVYFIKLQSNNSPQATKKLIIK